MALEKMGTYKRRYAVYRPTEVPSGETLQLIHHYDEVELDLWIDAEGIVDEVGGSAYHSKRRESGRIDRNIVVKAIKITDGEKAAAAAALESERNGGGDCG